MKQVLLLLLLFCLIISFAFSQTDMSMADMASSFYTDGDDTIYIIGEEEIDTSLTSGGRLANSYGIVRNQTQNSSSGAKVLGEDIYIQFKTAPLQTINQGMHGVNLTGIFEETTLPEGPESEDQWRWLSDLTPEVVRFPGGSYSKFTHLRTGSKGYGYNLQEIARYFDYSDGTMNNPTFTDILDDLDIFDSLIQWIGINFIAPYTQYRQKWDAQQLLAPGDRYIEQFIDLIDQIETDHPGHIVQVIVCLNILSETATECKNIINYLRSNGVTVAGVEMGNEVGGQFHQTMLSIGSFEDYYDYLFGNMIDTDYTLYMSGAFLADHDFIPEFKIDPLFECKVGLSGSPLEEDTYVFRMPFEIIADDEWNEAMTEHYNDTIAMTGGDYALHSMQ